MKTKKLVAVWLALLLLLALSLWVRHWGTAVGMGIAGLKGALVMAVFMELDESSRSVRVMALATFFWLVLMTALIFVDLYTRLG